MGKVYRLTLILILGSALIGWLAGAAHAADESWSRTFRAIRKNQDIGHHRVSVRRQGEETRVVTEIELSVKLLGMVTVYTYHHRSDEIWRGGRLVSIHSRTDDNGDKLRLDAEAEGDQLRIKGTDYTGLAPGDIMPTSYWNADFPRHGLLLNTQSGKLLKVTVGEKPVEPEDGVPPGSKRYALDGDLRLEIWYDAQPRWTKIRFQAESDGSIIDYKLVD